MGDQGIATRERILAAAQDLVVDQGFAATSIDQILARVQVTKGAFFYHFKSKDALAEALLERFLAFEDRLMTDTIARAERLARDPLQQLLVFIELIAELFDDPQAPYPGCLLASYVHEQASIPAAVLARAAEAMLRWRRDIHAWLERIAAIHPPRGEVALADVADFFNTVIEGAYIMARTLQEKRVVAAQIRLYKSYVELLFAPAAAR